MKKNNAHHIISLIFYLTIICFSSTRSSTFSDRLFILTISALIFLSYHTDHHRSMLLFTVFTLGWACYQPAITSCVNLVAWVLSAMAFCRICDGE